MALSNDSLRPGTTYAAILGRVLAYHRETKGLEQSDLASTLNIGQSSWSRIERGDSVINIEQLRIVAKRLGISAYDILKESDEATDVLEARDVEIKTAKSMKQSNDAIALIGLAALTVLVLGIVSKK